MFIFPLVRQTYRYDPILLETVVNMECTDDGTQIQGDQAEFDTYEGIMTVCFYVFAAFHLLLTLAMIYYSWLQCCSSKRKRCSYYGWGLLFFLFAN